MPRPLKSMTATEESGAPGCAEIRRSKKFHIFFHIDFFAFWSTWVVEIRLFIYWCACGLLVQMPALPTRAAGNAWPRGVRLMA